MAVPEVPAFSAWFLHVHLRASTTRSTWIDTTYFVFITILTIGYGDVFPTTDAGKSYVCRVLLVGACLGSVISVRRRVGPGDAGCAGGGREAAHA